MSGSPPPPLATLAEIEAAVWRELARAPHDRHHEWRTPVLCTTDDGLPDARVVVLREAEANTRTLRVYTDARSAKVHQLLAQPQAVLVVWSKRLSWQLRIAATVTVAIDGLAVSSR
jgi:pyridoxamine 5'-phosphate oxidase